MPYNTPFLILECSEVETWPSLFTGEPLRAGAVGPVRIPQPRQPATLQCDAPTRRSNGTCSRHICVRCATEVGPDQHLCPAHQAEQQQRQDHEPMPMEPWQAGLF